MTGSSSSVGDPARPVLSARGLKARYPRPQSGRLWPRKVVEGPWALDDVSVDVRVGEVLGVVGRSGSGKTTLARCLTGLLPLTEGEVDFQGTRLPSRAGRVQASKLRGVQMAFQDPYSTLNPRRKVGSVLSEILRVHRLCPRAEVGDRARHLLDRVGLEASVLDQRPDRLSGGMCQRVAIARALALEPQVLIADEIVSALDASVQAQVLNLIRDLCDATGIGVLLVTHDLAVVSQVCDRLAVMLDGRVVEYGDTQTVLRAPAHAYTRELLASVPELPTTEPRFVP